MEPLRYNEVSEEDIFDFVRCQRADGSFYGTSGTCRKGVQVGPKEKAALKKAAKAGNKKAEVALAVVEGKMSKAQAKKELGKAPAKKAEAVKEVKPKKTAKKKKEETKEKLTPAQEKLAKAKAKFEATQKKKEEQKAAKAAASKAKKEEAKKTAEKGTGEAQAEASRNKLKTKEGREEAQELRNTLFANFRDEAASAPPEKGLTYKNENTIFQYTRDRPPTDPTSYSNMNRCARNPDACTPAAEKANRDLDKALKAAPANTAGGAHYRGMNLTDQPALASQLENLKVGDTFADGGFGSYSRSPQSAATFLGDRNNTQTRNFMMISRSKKIRGIENYSDWPDELEGVLPRGTSQTVRSIFHVGNTTYIEVD